jgi:hypothetical protein
MDFSDWITKKYVAWRGDAVGNVRSITDFADFVGVKQPVMSSWMKKGGKIPRSQGSISKLVRAFGPEVYDVLGLPRPGSSEDIDLSHLPDDFRKRLKSAAAETNRILEEHGLYGLEAENETIRIFEEFGFKYVKTEKPVDES